MTQHHRLRARGMQSFSRERLHARIDAARRAPVTLVIGEEGLGKSTLVREYLALRAVPHVAFAAGPEHALPADFLRGLAAAFGKANPAMASSAGPASLNLAQADGEAAALSWAREHLAGVSTTVVLDELHHVLGEPRTAAFLVALIEATRGELEWLLVARDAALLPLPRWLATGVAELPIESSELRVQPDELAAAAAAAGLDLDARALAALHERTGGWPLGLAMALAGGRHDDGFGREEVYERVVDIALARFPSRDRERVYETALFGRFGARILAALECEPELLGALTDCGLAYACDDTDYAYYEPYRRRLWDRANALDAGERSAILDRAAAALQRVGRWDEAIALRIRAGDGTKLAETLESNGFKAIDRGDVATVRNALAALPEELLERRPVAVAMKAALASLDQSFDVSEAYFRIAIERASEADRREIVIRFGMDLVRRGRSDVIDLLESEAARSDTRSSADADAAMWALLGTAYVEAHRPQDARDAVRRALIRVPGMQDDGLRARVLHQASYVALNDGDYDAARDLAERALARADETFLYDLSARALSVLFNIAMLHDGDVPVARRWLARLEEAGRKAGSDALRLYAILNSYAIEVDAGDTRAIERLDAQLREMQVLITSTVSEALLPAQALRATWDGRFAHAYDLLAHGAENLFDDDRIAYRWAEVAVYAAAASKHADAFDAILRSREHLLRVDASQALALRTVTYLAIAEFLLGHDDEAERVIAQARRDAGTGRARFFALLDAIAALCACRAHEADALYALDTAIDVLDQLDLGGVGRFIGALPLAALDLAAGGAPAQAIAS
jgi:ATP/maltotriose-dependent transcriptional regulator MalT